MRFDYHDLFGQQFEDLVHGLCVHLLGAATQRFSKGPDGGRDARFKGTAAAFPNAAHPVTGKIIVQAKHTDNPVAKISDAAFSGTAKSSVMSEEILRISRLREGGELDHYILFTNRRGGGNAVSSLEERIVTEAGVESVTVLAIETLDPLLRRHPEAVEVANLQDFLAPLRVIPDQLVEVVLAIREEIGELQTLASAPGLERESFAAKNERNDLSAATAKKIVSTYMKDFGAIDEFLAAPANSGQRAMYEDAAAEFDAEFRERQQKGASMDSLLNDLVHRLRYRDADLSRNTRLTRTLIYYMYWKCDIGRET